MNGSRRWLVLCPTVAGLALAVAVLGCGRRADAPPTAAEPPPPAPLPADIEAQVHDFCGGSCHAYPPPDSFPRGHWRTEVERGFRFFDRSGLPLAPPKLAHVIRYYEERAPDELPPARLVPAARPLGTRFEPVTYPAPTGGRPMISHVSAVKLPGTGAADPKVLAREPLTLLACDMANGKVLALRPTDPKPAWKVLAAVPNPAHAEVLDLDGDGVLDIVVADLGSFPPTDQRCGSVVWLRGKPDGTYQGVTLLKDVGRVADVRAADFYGRGKRDLIVGVFGLHAVGETILLENKTADWARPAFEPHVIDARHGPIHVPVADLNGDGKPDFVALIAQEHETVVAFINQGNGAFAKETLYSAPHPGWGSSGIQLVDMNGDGKIDVLYTNGDILDEPYLWKPYHGIQWLENTGDLKFEHRRIADMYGVHNAVAAHVTGGKLPDVLAVSFLPGDKFADRVARKADAVVLFEQVAPGKFERHALATGSCDAVVCAAADLYGTGRPDLVVGNFSSQVTTAPVTIWKNGGKK
ncbi:MAG TPA: VCBS repeat-containing protein [Gemmata sp.]